MQANRPQSAHRYWLAFAVLLLQLSCANTQVPVATATSLPSTTAAQALKADGDQRKRLLDARTALTEHQPYTAINLLPVVPTDVPTELQIQISSTRAQAYDMSGNALESVRERIRLENLLSDANAQHDNHRAIWAALATLSVTALEQLRLAPPPDVLSGWMELAVIAKTAGQDAAALQKQIDGWTQRYPQHPAGGDIVARLLGKPESVSALPAGDAYPAQLAVLLPLSGDNADVAQALRNGLLAAYYRHRWGGNRPQLRFYDTGHGDSGLRRYYDQAVKDGAKLVIGPLTKGAVADLAHSGALSVQVLALNQIEGAAPALLYQFALAPEDEARQAAERASLDGHTHALAMVPAGAWGARQLQAFTDRFQELGGTVTRVERYGANSDFVPLIQHLLTHAPDTQTQTADMLFMVAFPPQARLITEQLRAQQAGALSVYASSHLYDGRAGGDAATGLDGVIFCDIPWMLSPSSLSSSERTQSARFWPASMEANARLYALGIDAYNIVPYLGRLGNSPTTGYPGESGRLYLDAGQHLHRQLMWARYSGNTALPINDAPLNWTPATPNP
jgi:outer membrane PBP1 activator LpoA protein